MIDILTYIVYVSLLVGILLLISYQNKVNPIEYNVLDDSISISKGRFELSHFIALLLISFIVGFRYNVGVDWKGYKEAFELISLNPTITYRDQNWEWGYFIINKLIATAGGHYSLMFFTVAFISWFFVFRSVSSTILPFLIYFIFTSGIFFWSMNGVRQFIAFSIFLYSIQYIINQNFRYYLLLLFVAFLFHRSILFVAPIYFLPFNKMYNRGFWLTTFITSLFIGNMPYFIEGVKNIATYIFHIIPLLSDYTHYFDRGIYAAQDIDIGLGFFFIQIVTIIMIIFSKEIILEHPKLKIFFILYFVGAISFNLFYSVQLIGRVNLYFVFLRAVVLSITTFYFLNNRKYWAFGIILIASYFGLFLYMIYASESMCSPYNFSFN